MIIIIQFNFSITRHMTFNNNEKKKSIENYLYN